MKGIRKKLKIWTPGLLFLAPAFIFFAVFVLYPLVQAFIMSFQNITLQRREWTGFGNYTQIFSDPVFIRSLTNTALMAVINVPVVVLFSFFVSNVIYSRSEFIRAFVRGAFYIPAVSTIVSISIVWLYIFNPNFGLLSYLASMVGVENFSVMSNATTALIAMTVVLFTLNIGAPIILFTAARGNLPSHYIEAAQIDGASRMQQTWRIVWPLLKPTTLYIVIITTINSFQTFVIVRLISGGGPYHGTSTIVFLLYKAAFERGQFGLANAMGIVLTVIVVFISVLQYSSLSSDVSY